MASRHDADPFHVLDPFRGNGQSLDRDCGPFLDHAYVRAREKTYKTSLLYKITT